MGRRFYSVSSVVVVFGTVLACVGDDPSSNASSSTSSSSGSLGGDGGGTGAATCSATSPCATGTCVDGYCCDTPCTGVCEACNVKGSEGKCSPATGKPLHGKCDGDADGVCAGTCDGKNGASCTYPDVECGKGSCAGGTATVAPKCKAGTCPAATTQSCSLGCVADSCLGVKQIAAGSNHACVLLSDGHVRCWGDNTVGQCGPLAQNPATQPTEVTGITGATAIAAAGAASCALLANGDVKCWGGNMNGELGRGGAPDSTLTKHADPALVAGLAGATFIRGATTSFFCAIVGGGTLKCWGANQYGQLGAGTATPEPKTNPVTVCAVGSSALPCADSSGVKFVAAGDRHACAIFANDVVACWGQNSRGETGQSPNGNVLFPKNVDGNLTATYLAGGNSVSCAVSGGVAKCWGDNGLGRLGSCAADNASFYQPQTVGTNAGCSQALTGATGVTTFDESTCAVANGAVKCWGSGGQLGDGSATAAQSYAASSAVASDAVYVASAASVHYAVVKNGVDSNVKCWGNEGTYECGTGTSSTSRPTPVSPKW